MLTFEQIEANIKAAPARPDVADARDLKISAIGAVGALVDLPVAFSLRAKMTPVRNQGQRGTCSAHAIVAISEFFKSQDLNETSLDLSEEFQFKQTKAIDLADYGFAGYGAYLRSAAKAFQKFGQCLEATMPYQPTAPENCWANESISNDMLSEATKYRSLAYASVNATSEELKGALVKSNAPLLIGIQLYASYRASASNGGFIPIPSADELPHSGGVSNVIGGHALALVGYDATHFMFKNSWGEDWGDHGYVYFPIAGVDFLFSAWSFLDLVPPAETQNALIAQNRAQVPDWALASWDKAIAKGLVTGQTKFSDIMHKGEYFVFLDRAGQL